MVKPGIPFSFLQSSDSWLMPKSLSETKVWHLILQHSTTQVLSCDFISLLAHKIWIGLVKVKAQFSLHAYWFHSTVRPSSCPRARFIPVWTRICFRVCFSSVVGVEDNFYLICCFHNFVGLNHKTYLQRAESQHLNPLVITQLLYLSYFCCLLCTFSSSSMSIRCAHEKHTCIWHVRCKF